VQNIVLRIFHFFLVPLTHKQIVKSSSLNAVVLESRPHLLIPLLVGFFRYSHVD
jgi:hypothetical protein